MLAFLLPLLASVSAAPAESAKGDLRSLFVGDDYPVAAQRANQQGDVKARLTIGESGRVTACTIEQSSGHAPLDTATCDILIARARFTPARDAQGRPVADEVTTPPIHWRLYDDPRAASLRSLFSSDDYPEAALLLGQEGMTQAQVTVGPDGRAADCQVVLSSGHVALDQATCRVLMDRVRFGPAAGPPGQPAPDYVTSPPIVWRIAGYEVPIQAWSSRLMVAVDRKDQPTMCSVQFGGALKKRESYVVDCSRLAGAIDVPEALARAHAGRQHVIIFDWQFVPRAVNSINTPKDLKRFPLINREVARFEIAADGRVTACKQTESEGAIKPSNPICVMTSGQRFQPAGRQGRGVTSATSTRATYVYVK